MGLRCRYCKRIWPNQREYEICPWCREPTVYTQQEAMPEHDAQSQAIHGNFGWWLYEQDRV